MSAGSVACFGRARLPPCDGGLRGVAAREPLAVGEAGEARRAPSRVVPGEARDRVPFSALPAEPAPGFAAGDLRLAKHSRPGSHMKRTQGDDFPKLVHSSGHIELGAA
jgi:hypothetical protein